MSQLLEAAYDMSHSQPSPLVVLSHHFILLCFSDLSISALFYYYKDDILRAESTFSCTFSSSDFTL